MVNHEARTFSLGPEATDDVRILRRVDLPTGPTGRGGDAVAGFGVVVDVETTGTDLDTDVIIELAARRFAYDDRHVITRIDRPYVWLEDPKRPLSDEIVRITGLVDADLAGRRIDEVEASRVIGSATVRVAHNAAFDRPFVERRLPGIVGLPWACSISDVGWTDRGFESAKLGWLLTQCGFFHDGHRAAADVDATIRILQHELVPGRTALDVMMERASSDSWIVRAFGAAFDVKDALRARGYRWNALQRVWWKELRDRLAEETWLSENVYSAGARPKGRSADFERVDWLTRYER
jgi:DNA polymerase-3 subunit epsilon